MSALIIPYYVSGFELDWTKVIPINENDVGMYIHPRLCVTFERIFSPEQKEHFSISHFMETNEDIDCDDFRERIINFKPFKNARIKRVFDGKRKSIFFDEEEVEILAGVFSQESFTAIIHIYVDGKQTSIKDLPLNLYKIVKPLLENYNVIYPLSIDEYRRFVNIKKVKIKNKKKKGEKKMNKRKSALKLVGGILLEGVSIAGSIVGMKMISEGYEELAGEIEEVIIDEDDGEEVE